MQLPEDLVSEILVKLSVKSLVRLSLLCKSWHELIIQNPYFGNKHLPNKDTDPTLIFLSRVQSSDDSISILHEDILLTDKPNLRLVSRETTVLTRGRLRVVGSCNGIICFAGIGGLYDFRLYNPVTRANFEHPPRDGYYAPKLGFGFDTTNNDYKVVRISEDRTEVYRCRTNTWSKVDQFENISQKYKFETTNKHAGVFVSGFFNWPVEKKSRQNGLQRDVILTFDFQNEIFGEIEYPKRSNWRIPMCTSVLDDSLAVFLLNRYGSYKHDVWVMGEYGKTESWTKKFSVALPASAFSVVETFWELSSTNQLVTLYQTWRPQKTESVTTYLVNDQEDEAGWIFSQGDKYVTGVVFRPTLTNFTSNHI